MDFQFTDNPDPIFEKTVRQLRETKRGIKILETYGKTRPYMIERLTKKTNKKNQAEQNSQMNRPFIAWDGEGWTDYDNEHRYMLFGSSTGHYVEWPQLSTMECLNLILSVGRLYPHHTHVIYGGGYDVTHILRDVPSVERDKILARGADGTYWKGYYFEYVAHKWFTVYDGTTRVKMYDVMTFFQSSFIKALQSRGIEVPQKIVDGKASRSSFSMDDMETIKDYWSKELELLVTLCNALRDELREAGITLSQWHGPGAVASKVFNNYGIASHKQRSDNAIERAAAGAYFGGRFECFRIGHYDGHVWQYDINSAYPDKIRNLPSLANATWTHVSKFDPTVIGLWFCSYNHYHRPATHIHPTPWRDKSGSVGFPATNEGVWLWTWEAELADVISKGYALNLASDEKPFGFVSTMFDTRKRWKAEGKGGERALKLAMNSLYGKMAQQIGGRHGQPPRWHQIEWAGMVTSQTRRQLWDAIAQKPESVIAVETDSITLTEPIDLDCGPGLGQWELTEYDWITYLQSGVYYVPDSYGNVKVKSRGFDSVSLPYERVQEFMRGERSVLDGIVRRFYAMGNPREGLYGQWGDEAREVNHDNGKRLHLPATCPTCRAGATLWDCMHPMVNNPFMGLEPSKLHPLPWHDTEPNEPGFVEQDIAIEDWRLNDA